MKIKKKDQELFIGQTVKLSKAHGRKENRKELEFLQDPTDNQGWVNGRKENELLG